MDLCNIQFEHLRWSFCCVHHFQIMTSNWQLFKEVFFAAETHASFSIISVCFLPRAILRLYRLCFLALTYVSWSWCCDLLCVLTCFGGMLCLSVQGSSICYLTLFCFEAVPGIGWQVLLHLAINMLDAQGTFVWMYLGMITVTSMRPHPQE